MKLDFGELPMPAIVKPVPMWTGKQVVSLLIPAEISVTILKGKDGYKNKDDTSMVIRNGELISGALQK
jgi:DNA-directed RNA polymerase II subunit RPB1